MNNGITNRQNSKNNLIKLAAQRKRYSDAKCIMALQFSLSIGLIIGLCVIGFLFEDVKPLISSTLQVLGFVITLLNLLLFDILIAQFKEEAANIQEYFDSNVLKIPWNNIKIDKPHNENIKTHANKLIKSDDDFKKFRLLNWYNPSVEEVPLVVGRIISQRTNCWWDRSLGEKFIFLIVTLTVISIIILFAFFAYNNVTLAQLCFVLLFPSLPAIVLMSKYILKHFKYVKFLKHLEREIDQIWDSLLRSPNEYDGLDVILRQIQDSLLDSRKNRPLIPDWFYEHFRSSYEDSTKYSVDEMVKKYNDNLNNV